MKKRWAQIQTLANSVVEKANMRKSMMTVVAVAVLTAFFVLQFYFVRELVAAELRLTIAERQCRRPFHSPALRQLLCEVP